MRSIRTKATILNTVSIAVAMAITTAIGAISIAGMGHESAEQSLSLLCETGKNNIDYYFKSIEQSVNTVSGLVDANLDTIASAEFIEKLPKHVEQVRAHFAEAATHTSGVLTYYYRIDPEYTRITNEKGFWYTNVDGKGFVEHEVTEISDNENECLWFYNTKKAEKSIWLPPYVTDNLPEFEGYVLSYNAPVYRDAGFIGVIGIEIGYRTLGEQINGIKALQSGFAFIVDSVDGSIIYHPQIDILSTPESERPVMPSGFNENLQGESHHFEYTFNGVSKHAYWQTLSNDMKIIVAAPSSEVSDVWLRLVTRVLIVAFAVLGIFAVVTILWSRHITKPLEELTHAAEKINQGDYSVHLDCKEDDEIGVLTTTVNKLVDHLGGYINDLNSLAYADALTSVANKSAFDLAMGELQARIENKEEQIEFAVAIFDCDDLKVINDRYGHDKGNVYLKNSCLLIALVFEHSKIYRIGGDEFAVILEGEDYENREKLRQDFLEKGAEICAFAKEEWEKVRISVGIAAYDPEVDAKAEDVMVYADHLMYENKRERKKKGK